MTLAFTMNYTTRRPTETIWDCYTSACLFATLADASAALRNVAAACRKAGLEVYGGVNEIRLANGVDKASGYAVRRTFNIDELGAR